MAPTPKSKVTWRFLRGRATDSRRPAQSIYFRGRGGESGNAKRQEVGSDTCAGGGGREGEARANAQEVVDGGVVHVRSRNAVGEFVCHCMFGPYYY